MLELVIEFFWFITLLKVYIIDVIQLFKGGKKAILDLIDAVTAIINVWFVFLVYKLTHKEVNPKLYVTPQIKDANNQYDRGLNMEVDNIDFNKKGFPEINHATKLWAFTILNNGDLPATDVVIEYKIILKKAEFDYGIDEADIVNDRFVDFKTITRKVNIDYIPPTSNIEEKVLFLTGKFPYAELIITRLSSKERTYINKPILLQTYEHPEFLVLEDSDHLRRMLGAYNEE